MKKERQCTRSRAKENVALPDNAATQPTTMQTRFRAAMVSKAEDRFFIFSCIHAAQDVLHCTVQGVKVVGKRTMFLHRRQRAWLKFPNIITGCCPVNCFVAVRAEMVRSMCFSGHWIVHSF